ncbi:MAG: hypothetical protein GY782_05085 [Gammaproteobacteria bacterium]|nr:hypothetical protein [Gammaproteobacteria bacterium]
MSDCLEFSVKVLRGTDVVGSSSKGSDDAVLGGVGSAGGVLRVEVGVSRFPVYRGGFVRVNEYVKERNRSVRGRMLLSKVEVFSEGVEEGEEGFGVLSVSECSKSIVDEMRVGVGRVRRGREGQSLDLCESYLC